MYEIYMYGYLYVELYGMYHKNLEYCMYKVEEEWEQFTKESCAKVLVTILSSSRLLNRGHPLIQILEACTKRHLHFKCVLILSSFT